MKTFCNFLILGLVATALAGCSSKPSMKDEPVTVSGTVLLPNGKPASNVVVNFLPSSSEQMMGAATLKADGKFTAKLNPGKYTYMFEGQNIKTIPVKYHSNSTENSFEVPAAGMTDLTIKLN